jgi:hypothetical protein
MINLRETKSKLIGYVLNTTPKLKPHHDATDAAGILVYDAIRGVYYLTKHQFRNIRNIFSENYRNS